MVLTFRHSQPPHRHSLDHEPDPADVEKLARQAATYAGRGETARALRCYELALLADEARGDVWYQYGSLQFRSGMLAEALESFEFALRLDPTLYAARHKLARVRCDMGYPLEALSQFRMVTEQRPGYAPAWRYLVQLTWALGNFADAESCAREGLRRTPGDNELESLLQRVLQDRTEAQAEG